MKIKVCGITNLADARAAVAAGVDMLGFVFYPKSPRCVSPEQAAEIIRALPPEIDKVGVFVNADRATLLATAASAGLTVLQLHGSESRELIDSLPRLKVVKAVALRCRADLEALGAYAGLTLLVDTPSPAHGGSGRVGDWALAARVAGNGPTILAGGLTPENVAAAIAAVRPWGVDVSSGVEREPGSKDAARIRAFVAAARSAS